MSRNFRKNLKKKDAKGKKKWQLEVEEIEKIKAAYSQMDINGIKTFDDLPLSSHTREGLRKAGYTVPTKIQIQAIVPALRSHNILGAAKTGSGKTLAFIIPILELLWRERWTQLDGPGALIVSPTRELALQTFETINKVGVLHNLSVGLVIGGKRVNDESSVLTSTNIIISTPGRLVHHLEQTVGFHLQDLQILVLDEADRMLDEGFRSVVELIVNEASADKQTLLFSATQTKSVEDLRRLKLKDFLFVSVDAMSRYSTPTKLRQNYIVCDLAEKMDFLWSFIKHHLKTKSIVFLATCKQVRFIFEMFSKCTPGVTLLHLHGGMSQQKRLKSYDIFCRKKHAVLFATDIAARGLDFPNVDWVIQYDCPEDTDTYIHRAGRTARFSRGGESLLVLLPSEEPAMIKHLESHKVPIEKINIRKSLQCVRHLMDKNCAADTEMKAMAHRAFLSYLKDVFMQPDKRVFRVGCLDRGQYARSLGLPQAPRVRFLEKLEKSSQKVDNTETNKTKKHSEFLFPMESDDSGDELFKVEETAAASEDGTISSGESEADETVAEPRIKRKRLTKAAMAKKVLKKKFVVNQRVVFTEQGELAADDPVRQRLVVDTDGETGLNVEEAKKRMEEEDIKDKAAYRLRVKMMHREKRLKMRAEKNQDRKDSEDEESVYNSDIDWSTIPDPDNVYENSDEITEEANGESWNNSSISESANEETDS